MTFARRNRRGSASRLLPLLAFLASIGSVVAQELHRTPDGSRFLLLPTDGPPLVHWAIASPAGPMEDPVGTEGLSWAVLVASLYGTGSIGTLDAEAERQALERMAGLERSLAADPSDEGVERQLAAARLATAALSDPRAYRRVLAAAPASGLRVRRAPHAGLVLLTTVPEGVERVGELLHDRREDNRLRALDAALAGVRAEEARHRDDPVLALLSEAVALAFAGHPWSTAAPREIGAGAPRRDAAWKVWQRTQLPSRCLHVLTGNFDPEALGPVLNRCFARTTLKPEGGRIEEAEAASPPSWPSSVRRATVPPSRTPAAVLALPAPDVERATLLWAADLVAGGGNSVLAEALADRGWKQATVRWTGPFPDGRPGSCLLVIVENPQPAENLGSECLSALRDAAELLRHRPSLEPTRSRRLAEVIAITGDARELAGWLAGHLLHSRDPESEARGLLRGPADDEVYGAARTLVEGARPVLVESRER